MTYQIGDQIVHLNHGPGTIIGLEKKSLAGQTRLYYVVEVAGSTLWVPVDENGEKNLRPPTPSADFKEALNILSSPGEKLPDQQYERQNQLVQRMHNKTLDEICRIIRDLAYRSHSQRLNRNDADILKRAEDSLLDEWEIVLGTPRETAQRELDNLLKENSTPNTEIKA